jgi:4-amino-4-deoxy-L-arabinose transferase-like glycosyltransferase
MSPSASSPRARSTPLAESTLSSTRLRFLPEALALAALLAITGVVYARDLHTAAAYDEGNYLASLDALRHGQHLGSDIFVDQPPGWYVLLQLDALVFGNTVAGVRTGLLVFSLFGIVAAWACGRAFGGPLAGLGAAVLLAIAPPFPSLAARVEADPPATVLCIVALALAAWAFRNRTQPWLAAAAGAVFVLAVSVKLLAVAAAPPLLALALRRNNRLQALAFVVAGGVVVVLAFVIAYASVLHPLWTGIYSAHAHARTHVPGQPDFTDNVHRVLHFLDLHTPFGWVVPFGALVTVTLRGWRVWPLWLFALSAAAFVVWQKPLLDHHLVLLAAGLALPAGTALGRALDLMPRPVAAAAVVAGAVAIAAALYQQNRQLRRNDTQEPVQVRWAVAQVRAHTAPSDLVASDLPIVPYLADRRMPGSVIDTSLTRIVGEFTKPEEMARLIDRSGAKAVVVGRLFLAKPAIVAGIRKRFPHHLQRYGTTVYLR